MTLRTKVSYLMIVAFFLTAYSSSFAQVTILAGKTNNGIEIKLTNDIKTVSANSVVDTSKQNFGFDDLVPGKLLYMQDDVLKRQIEEDINNLTSKAEQVKVVLPLADMQIHIVTKVADKSKNLSFAELKKEDIKMGVGPKGEQTATTAEIIKKLTGAKWTEIYTNNTREAIRKLMKGEINAFVVIGTAPIEALDIFSNIPQYNAQFYKLVNLEDVELMDDYTKVVMNKATYKWIPYDVQTYAVRNYLVTRTAGETQQNKSDIGQFLTDMKAEITKIQKCEGCQLQIWKGVNFSYQNINDSWIHSMVNETFNQKFNKTTTDPNKKK